jgi:hypothetical protein
MSAVEYVQHGDLLNGLRSLALSRRKERERRTDRASHGKGARDQSGYRFAEPRGAIIEDARRLVPDGTRAELSGDFIPNAAGIGAALTPRVCQFRTSGSVNTGSCGRTSDASGFFTLYAGVFFTGTDEGVALPSCP